MPIHIGCGSWTDDAYVGLLYPKGSPKTARLHTYAHWFDRVEVNSTYYATPSRKTVATWVAQTPAHFIFDVKLHRRFSENPRAAADGDLVEILLEALEPLLAAKRLGAFLLTLAPGFGPPRHALDELDGAAGKLRPHAPLAVELRHRGWVEGAALASTLAYFRARQLSWVALDLPRLRASAILPPIDEVTDRALAYVRLHGRNPRYLQATDAAGRHHHDYTAAELEEIAARLEALAARAKNVHVSVNNHAENFAPKAALALRRLLGQPVPPALSPEAGDDQLPLLD